MKINIPWGVVMGVDANVNSKFEKFLSNCLERKTKSKIKQTPVRTEFNSENITWNQLPWPNHAIKVKRAKLLMIYNLLEYTFLSIVMKF